MNKLQSILILILFISLHSCGVRKSMEHRPEVGGWEQIDTTRLVHSKDHFSLGKNSLRKNEFGIWELYLEGDALERGLAKGSLTRELMERQERTFMNQIEAMVPSDSYRNFLKKTIAWFNRNMYKHVPEEYQQEIFGVSRFAPKEFDDFAAPYLRMLYYHAAHDIGHALQDLMLVGCTSFAAWDEKTTDGSLLLGRNFDFYVGDEFAEEKIAAFINPAKGHKFMMYTWGGMIGAVSGMNEKGLTVTINAGKSNIPLQAKTPVSLVAREILQYAENTAEAIEIAKNREVFVAEAIMVGSARENKAILIEVSPNNFGVFEVDNSNELICSNHFQSEAYKEDRRNQKTINNSHTQYRYERMMELLQENDKLNPEIAVNMLRNKEGLAGAKLGFGNEKAINQLLAHHGIVFKPAENMLWVSANPYQLGEFVAYDLDEVFAKFEAGNVMSSVASAGKNIARDPFIDSQAFKNYEKYRKLSREIRDAIDREQFPQESKITELKRVNPHFWKAYALAGDYYYETKDYKQAVINYKQALRREVSSKEEEAYLEKMIKKAYRKF